MEIVAMSHRNRMFVLNTNCSPIKSDDLLRTCPGTLYAHTTNQHHPLNSALPCWYCGKVLASPPSSALEDSLFAGSSSGDRFRGS
jgi:hypothetical protein